MIIGDRIREAADRVFLVLEDIVHDLVIESSVREIHLTREGLMRSVGGSQIPQSPLQLYNLRSVYETNLPDEESFFPAGAVAVGLEWADASLGVEEGGWNLRWWGEGQGGCRSNCVAGTVSEEVALDETKVENAVSRRQR